MQSEKSKSNICYRHFAKYYFYESKEVLENSKFKRKKKTSAWNRRRVGAVVNKCSSADAGFLRSCARLGLAPRAVLGRICCDNDYDKEVYPAFGFGENNVIRYEH